MTEYTREEIKEICKKMSDAVDSMKKMSCSDKEYEEWKRWRSNMEKIREMMKNGELKN